MQLPKIAAYMMTCPARASVLADTLDSFRRTDWPERPRIILDTSDDPDPKTRQVATAHRLLQEAIGQPWDYLLFLEDDLHFNKYLHRNLMNWHPTRYGFATLATLYTSASRGIYAGQHFFTTLAASHGGSQALLIHRKVVEEVLSGWSSFTTELHDIRIAGIASRIDPIIHVFDPNLVQHRGGASTWGGGAHVSPTFDADFKLASLEGTDMTHVRFHHGLGDCANAAHLFALYRSLGHPIIVDCSPDKAPLFQAAGCQLACNAASGHPWDHAPAPGKPQLDDPWAGNKTAWNISRGGLPAIGGYAERWADLCRIKLDLEGLVPDNVKADVAGYLGTLPRPVVCLHTKGNTSPEKKNYPEDIHTDLYRAIIERVGGTLLLLDWDSRVPWFHHYALRHLKGDWKGSLTVLELYETIKGADCVVGVDSGVLHFSRFTDTPTVGIWRDHYPSHYALPSKNAVHLVGERHPDWTRRRRLAFNLIEVPGIFAIPGNVAEAVARMVQPRRFLADPGPDVLLQHLIDRCRDTSFPQYPFRDRHRTFSAFLGLLKGIDKPLVVETGCIRAEDDFSAGFSSYISGFFLRHHGGELHSVDTDGKNVGFAMTWTWAAGLPVTVHHSDSRPWLAGYKGRPIDGLYLDSADTDTPQYQEICLAEAKAALPKLAPAAPILIDDTPYGGAGRFGGKGGLAVPWLLEQGYKIKLAGYQVLLTMGDA